jgi:hypothetical protein
MAIPWTTGLGRRKHRSVCRLTRFGPRGPGLHGVPALVLDDALGLIPAEADSMEADCPKNRTEPKLIRTEADEKGPFPW